MIELRNIALDAIIESTFNPRKNFDPAKLAELSESIKASGVLQPILVRPLTGDRVSETDRTVQFEIIAGARRYRASVKVRISAQHLHPKQQKYAGKEGTITGKIGDAWDVTFRGRSGGISSFMADQISVVVA